MGNLSLKQVELTDMVVNLLTEKDVWRDLIEAFDAVISANVEDPIGQLEVLRFLPPNADPVILKDACRMLGFDLSQDVLNLSVDKFTKIATQLGRYPDSNGTRDFAKFIGLMINGICEVGYLWSKDYVNFYEIPKGELLENGGRWFKTTHVDLSMMFNTLEGLQLKPGQSLYGRMKELFYRRAPITLVIERFSFKARTEARFGFAAKLVGVTREYRKVAAGKYLPNTGSDGFVDYPDRSPKHKPKFDRKVPYCRRALLNEEEGGAISESESDYHVSLGGWNAELVWPHGKWFSEAGWVGVAVTFPVDSIIIHIKHNCEVDAYINSKQVIEGGIDGDSIHISVTPHIRSFLDFRVADYGYNAFLAVVVTDTDGNLILSSNQYWSSGF